MATSRAPGYVPTSTVWNALFASINDAGTIWSGAVNGSTGAFSSTLAVTGATTLTGHLRANGNIGINTAQNVARLNIPIGGATAEGGDYGRGIQVTGPGTNFGQMLALVRSGVRVWSVGYAYNSSVLAIGNGQTTDANFTEAAASLTIQTTGAVKAPLQPGFSAFNSATDTYTGVTTVSPLPFDTETFDTAANFASDVFTAPVAGIYRFTASLRLINNSGGTRRFALVTYPTNPTYLDERELGVGETATLSGSVETLLAASDTVGLRLEIDASATFDVYGAVSFTQRSVFSGRLLV